MKILLVHSDDIKRFPPVRNLLECLLTNGHRVTIITKDESDTLLKWDFSNLSVIKLKGYSGKTKAQIVKAFIFNRAFLRTKVPKLMKTHDLIWTTTDIAVRELGPQLLSYKHVMQMMELIETIPINPYLRNIKFNIAKYARCAYRVVVPEINRAYITKTWWELDSLPTVLPNKPYSLTIPDVPEGLAPYLEDMKNEKRKIILYQGVFYKDRDLRPIANAVNQLKDKYCLYIMGRDTGIRQELCEEYPDIKYIPFFEPPYHLLVTQLSHVGLLPYAPSSNYHFSVLNALYCAPNKIFEYAAFGLPMIGSDVPGLSIPFSIYKMGFCYKTEDAETIKKLLESIDNNYDEMSAAAKSFYESVNIDEIVKTILE